MITKHLILRSALTGLALTIPFIIMEIVNRWSYPEKFPFFLFAAMWLLTALLSGLLYSIYFEFTSEKCHASKWRIFLKAILAVAISAVWIYIVYDQMPCFLGLGNCD